MTPHISFRSRTSTAIAAFLLASICLIHPLRGQSNLPEAKAGADPNGAIPTEPSVSSADLGHQIHVTLGRSIVFTAPNPLRRIYVGNPSVLQTFTSGSEEIVLSAKAAGTSSLILWDEAGGHQTYTVFADLDPAGVRASIASAFPNSDIHADTSEGKVILTGSVATDAASDAALKIASLYSRDVVNSLRVVSVHGKQVQLKLRIVEIDRTRLDQSGINVFTGGRTATAISTQQFGSTASGTGSSLTVTDPLNIFLYNSKLNVGVTIQDLEQKQIAQILAEPTLTTMSGLTARFLSGGEFPFPVAQGGVANSTAISIQFRPYGVKVEFTPTVNPDGSIRLKLSPEVSALDYTNSVTISGFTIPALSTRRADTEVEIQNGQTFVVSGLLDHRTTEIMSKVPGIGNLPILGQFFRSKNFNHSVVELVILVTATVVDPLRSTEAQQPGEPKFVVPNLDSNTFDASVRDKAKPTQASPQAQPATIPPSPQSPSQP